MLGDYLDQIAQAVEWLKHRGYPVTWQEIEALHPAYPNVNDVVEVSRPRNSLKTNRRCLERLPTAGMP